MRNNDEKWEESIEVRGKRRKEIRERQTEG